MRSVDYDSTHLVKAVKGLELNANAYTNVSIDNSNCRVVNANKDEAIKWFASWAATQITALGNSPKVLAPIPSSKTVVASAEDYRTYMIAAEIAKRVPNSVVCSALRFVEARPSSREEGGSRDPLVLYPNMTLKGGLPSGQLILIDDLMTSGGHFIAASWELADHNRVPSLAIACGRSLDTPIENPFNVSPEMIDIGR